MSIIPNLEINRKLPLKISIYFLGSFISTSGVALITLNALGSNAMNTLFTAISTVLKVPAGNVYTVFNGSMMIVGFIFARRYMGIGSFLMILVQGFFINMWMNFYSANFSRLFVGYTKIIAAVLSILCSCFGGALSTSMQLGTAGFEACLFTLADNIKIEYKFLKTTSEIIYFVIAFFLNGVFGIMTIVEMASPFLSSYFMEKLNRTLWKWLEIDDIRNNLSRNRRWKIGVSKDQP